MCEGGFIMHNRKKMKRIYCICLILIFVLSTVSGAYASIPTEIAEPYGNGPKPTKYVIRSRMEAVVSGGRAAGYDMAADFLEHSLVDNPSDLTCENGSIYSNQIKNSAEYRSILDGVKNRLDNTSSTVYHTNSSTTLNSTTDLHLALNRVSYSAEATKLKTGKWKIKIVFHDTYDFAYQDWNDYSGFTGSVATILNNYGVYAMEQGAVVGYDIDITVIDTYY